MINTIMSLVCYGSLLTLVFYSLYAMIRTCEEVRAFDPENGLPVCPDHPEVKDCAKCPDLHTCLDELEERLSNESKEIIMGLSER